MSSKIKQSNIGKYTCLDFPKRKLRLLFDNKTKQYDIYGYIEDQSKSVKETEDVQSPLWKTATLVTVGICIGMVTIVGLMLLR